MLHVIQGHSRPYVFLTLAMGKWVFFTFFRKRSKIWRPNKKFQCQVMWVCVRQCWTNIITSLYGTGLLTQADWPNHITGPKNTHFASALARYKLPVINKLWVYTRTKLSHKQFLIVRQCSKPSINIDNFTLVLFNLLGYYIIVITYRFKFIMIYTHTSTHRIDHLHHIRVLIADCLVDGLGADSMHFHFLLYWSGGGYTDRSCLSCPGT